MKSLDSSFRDPMGGIFEHERKLYRWLAKDYLPHFQHFLQSGLYKTLIDKQLLVSHSEKDIKEIPFPGAAKVLEPQFIDIISYPYEWSFQMYKEAALLVLQIQQLAMEHGMSLRDASAYNIQFQNGKPIFIDTSSFEIWEKGTPWHAYRQFCKHFLGPLALMAFVDVGLNKLMQTHLDGIPLPLVCKLLPHKSRFSAGIQLHLFWHARSIQSHSNKQDTSSSKHFGEAAFKGLVQSLQKSVQVLALKKVKTIWNTYYEETILNAEYLDHKIQLIDGMLQKTQASIIWDIGSNDGKFSQIASKYSQVIATDADPYVIDNLYKTNNPQILPLTIDLANPSPGIGWANKERIPLNLRIQPDMIMALALIHHLCLSQQIPLKHIAQLFVEQTNWLLIEFIPISDPKVVEMTRLQKRDFSSYTEVYFEKVFSAHFTIREKHQLAQSNRTLFLMKANKSEA